MQLLTMAQRPQLTDLTKNKTVCEENVCTAVRKSYNRGNGCSKTLKDFLSKC